MIPEYLIRKIILMKLYLEPTPSALCIQFWIEDMEDAYFWDYL